MTTFRFETKTYLDENSAARDVDAVLVGRYYQRHAGLAVWACATRNKVHYLYGDPPERACKPVPEHFLCRIYYIAPFNAIAGSQEGNGRSAGRKAGRYIVEAVINYLFLNTSRLKRVSNCDNTDTLTNFQNACTFIAQTKHASDVDGSPVFKEEDSDNELVPSSRSTKKRKLAQIKSDIKEEEDDLGGFHLLKSLMGTSGVSKKTDTY